ncbi:MAG: DUF3137 domain-containing protein [Candidatus Muirbacterium halophilum]|nr:DUF3137 domain-containing protein [Candidatus Muirbacterium halophilum]MCK9474440.1 DUF3137 domain-containing protein [Candidatus Muirbacterium halophilum]
MKKEESLVTFYKRVLEPDLLKLEDKRKIIFKHCLFCLVFICIIIVCIIAFNINEGIIWIVIGFAAFIAIIIDFIKISRIYKDYSKDFKFSIVKNIVEFVNPKLNYSPYEFVSKSHFKKSRLFNSRIDNYKGDDYISGKIDKTELFFSELHVEKVDHYRNSKGKKRKRITQIFNGLFFCADFNKHFTGKTIIAVDKSEKIFGRLANTFQAMFSHQGELVKFEDPEFEKEFAVYSDSQQQARYIISPALARRIIDYKNKAGLDITMSFIDSSVYVAISRNEGFFDPAIFEKTDNFTIVSKVYEELMLALDLINILDLNTRIWTKE